MPSIRPTIELALNRYLELMMKKTMSKTVRSVAAAAVLGFAALATQAQVNFKNAWVRATVAQQKASGAFMTLAAARDLRLVAASSPRIPLIEIHEMSAPSWSRSPW